MSDAKNRSFIQRRSNAAGLSNLRIPLSLLILFSFSHMGLGQGVAINENGDDPNANAALDISSPVTGNGKGLLIPRVSALQRTKPDAALAGGLLDGNGNLRGGAAQGLMVYQTDGVQGFYYNTSTSSTPNWVHIGGSTGSVTSVSTTAPLAGGPITSSGTISINKASTDQDGYLDKASYATFAQAYNDRMQWDGGATNLNAATAKASLGLGDAASKNVGTASGTVAAGDDSRLVEVSSATNSATASTLVKRDATGGISVSTLTGNVAGNLTGSATLTGLTISTGAGSGKVLTSDAAGAGTWQTFTANSLPLGGTELAIGDAANATTSGAAIGPSSQGFNYGTAVGILANAYDHGAAVGFQANAYTFGVSLGYAANGYDYGASVGKESSATTNSASLGYQATSNSSSVSLGKLANAQNNNVALGSQADAGTNKYAIAKGYGSKCSREGEEWRSFDGTTNAYGYGVINLRNTTNSNTPTELFVDGVANSRFILKNSSTMTFQAMISARDTTGSGQSASWIFVGAMARDGSTNVAIICTLTKLTPNSFSGFAIDPTITNDSTNGALKIEVQADQTLSTVIAWSAAIWYTENRQ